MIDAVLTGVSKVRISHEENRPRTQTAYSSFVLQNGSEPVESLHTQVPPESDRIEAFEGLVKCYYELMEVRALTAMM